LYQFLNLEIKIPVLIIKINPQAIEKFQDFLGHVPGLIKAISNYVGVIGIACL